ncbi:MAG: hypothetical protein H6685_10150 [Deltaproteobacteria bacterium]|nr:hypothetical protein [Deltaproteobacteria bacterium]
MDHNLSAPEIQFRKVMIAIGVLTLALAGVLAVMPYVVVNLINGIGDLLNLSQPATIQGTDQPPDRMFVAISVSFLLLMVYICFACGANPRKNMRLVPIYIFTHLSNAIIAFVFFRFVANYASHLILTILDTTMALVVTAMWLRAKSAAGNATAVSPTVSELSKTVED